MGAGVMHSRSIEVAKNYNVLVHVRSSFSDGPGTLIGPQPERESAPACGLALAKDETRLTVVGVKDEPGVAMRLFSKIADAKIAIDMIAQSSSSAGRTDVSFTIQSDDALKAREVVEAFVKEEEGDGALGFDFDSNVAKISLVGIGMTKQTGVAQKMFHAISEAGVNIHMIATSDIKISALVGRDDAVTALRAVHEAFALHQEPTSEERSAEQTAASDEQDSAPFERGVSPKLLNQLAGMEDVVVEGIDLDSDQARVTLYSLPDRRGLAAEVFDRADMLKGMGLTVPAATEIALALKARGVELPESVYTTKYLTKLLLDLKAGVEPC